MGVDSPQDKRSNVYNRIEGVGSLRMASADDLIRVYERRLAEFEARLAAIERERGPSSESRASAPAAKRSSSGLRLGVDVGGTFTDLLLLDEKRARAFTAKVPSTPSDSSIGVLNGIEKICREAGIDPTDIDDVMHGTTVATNTVLTEERRARRSSDDQGLSRRSADRAFLRAGRPRRLGDLQQAAAARAARAHHRGRGAHRRRRKRAESRSTKRSCAAISPTSAARASRR